MSLGKRTGAWATFWNIRARHPQSFPVETFAGSHELCGRGISDPSVTDPPAVGGSRFATRLPQDLYEAQRRRLHRDEDNSIHEDANSERHELT